MSSRMAKLWDAMSTRAIVGESVVAGDVTVIPVVKAVGATAGEQPAAAVRTKPVGAFVVSNGVVSWQPAHDPTKVIIGGQVVGLVALLVLRSIVKRRRAREG